VAAARGRAVRCPLDWLVADGDPVAALDEDPRLGAEMQQRLGRGDAVGNLSIGGLVLNAYLATGEARYADRLEQYVRAWQKRAADNDGLVPDNVGLDGASAVNWTGRWYGGHYGRTWPHELYSIGQAVLVDAMAAALAKWRRQLPRPAPAHARHGDRAGSPAAIPGRPSGRSGTRRRPATRSRGTPISVATIRITRSRSWRRRPRSPGGGSR
jgi:hypothetical protein